MATKRQSAKHGLHNITQKTRCRAKLQRTKSLKLLNYRLSAKAVVSIFLDMLFPSPIYVVCLQTMLHVVGIIDGNIRCFTCIFERVFLVVFSWKKCCGHSHMLVGFIYTYAIGA